MCRPQFRLRSLFILTAVVAVGCMVGPPIVREVREWLWPMHEYSRHLDFPVDPGDFSNRSATTFWPARSPVAK